MIFWDEKRFACDSCIKGHRATKCLHIKKSLTEIKTKGRPNTQCPTCREKRQSKNGHPHHKCRCGSEPPKRVIYILKLIFDQGLVLEFEESSRVKVDELQSKLDSMTPFSIRTCSEKASSASDQILHLLCSHLSVEEKETDIEMQAFLDNPCKCHFGGECICFKRKGETSDPVESVAVLALANMSERPKTELAGCSCKSSSSGCVCNSNEGTKCKCNGSVAGSGCACNSNLKPEGKSGCGNSSKESVLSQSKSNQDSSCASHAKFDILPRKCCCSS